MFCFAVALARADDGAKLIDAAARGDVITVSALIKAAANINAHAPNEPTVLMAADGSSIKLLRAAGAKKEAPALPSGLTAYPWLGDVSQPPW